MPSFFSKLKGKDQPAKASKSKKNTQPTVVEPVAPVKPQWDDAWTRISVEPEEVMELVRGCTLELKSRALDMPFFLLPFRPTSDLSAAKTFIRTFFDRGQQLHGEYLQQELRLTEPMVICSVIKWCWSRLPGGVVTWESYELFKVGEQDSNMARDSFATFVPLSVESDARVQIIFDFFDLLSAIAAHGMSNGLGGVKLSRLAGWWAFDHSDVGKGFEGGYKGWETAADATTHLFFAYLRSLSPDAQRGLSGISTLPRSLQKLVDETKYPAERSITMQSDITKVVMIVDSVSPSPVSLLRRANNFQYRDDDRALQRFSEYEDPVDALTDECRRVLKSIASANKQQVSIPEEVSKAPDASWSRFEDIGFLQGFGNEESSDTLFGQRKQPQGLRTQPRSPTANMGRPTTPSWADFLSSGFVDESQNGPAPLLLPPDKILPPINTSRGRSAHSHDPRLEMNGNLEPGELTSITRVVLDDAFWWVWISSVSAEETAERMATFGRCAIVETVISGGRWLVLEEIVKGAAPAVEEGAYVAEKKSRFGWSKRNRGMSRRKSAPKQTAENGGKGTFQTAQLAPISKVSIGPDQHARIQAAATQLQQKQRQQEEIEQLPRRGRHDSDMTSHRTNSVFTLQPIIATEASSAMKWAHKYDKDEIREAYLANNASGKGLGLPPAPSPMNGYSDASRDPSRMASMVDQRQASQRDLALKPNSEETRPQVPEKASALPPAPLPPTPAAEPEEQAARNALADKAAEVGLPTEPHPVHRETGMSTSARQAETEEAQIDEPTYEAAPDMSLRKSTTRTESNLKDSAATQLSPNSKAKQRKLQKSGGVSGGGGGGFKKMFGRNKNRQSMMPAEVLTESQNGKNSLKPPSNGSLGRRFSTFKKKPLPPAVKTDKEARYRSNPPATESIVDDVDDDAIPLPSPQHKALESPYDNAAHNISRTNTNDEHEAHREFSKFDQGPLEDQPAFIPESPISEAPPAQVPAPAPEPISEESELTPTTSAEAQNTTAAPLQSQDRWAQIRKNVAERAAQKQTEEPAPNVTRERERGKSMSTDNDGETSGEETIEQKVAKIKARVAELTGNLDTGAPTAPNARR